MGKRIAIIGGGVIGLCAAYYCARRGWQVTLVDRNAAQRDGCSFQNAGMLVPSHFVPLAAPGMVALGLKWMWNPASPFYVKPRLSRDLLDWGVKFWRAATPEHVRRAAPLLRDLQPGQPSLLRRARRAAGQRFRPRQEGPADAVQDAACARGGNQDGGDRPRARHRGRSARRRGRWRRSIPACAWTSPAPSTFRGLPSRRPIGSWAQLQDRVAAGGVEFVWNTDVTAGASSGVAKIRAATTRDGARDRGRRIRALRWLVVAAARARARPAPCRCRPARATA